jgi:hypothetical protein
VAFGLIRTKDFVAMASPTAEPSRPAARPAVADPAARPGG